jgi:hypothetical protein
MAFRFRPVFLVWVSGLLNYNKLKLNMFEG